MQTERMVVQVKYLYFQLLNSNLVESFAILPLTAGKMYHHLKRFGMHMISTAGQKFYLASKNSKHGEKVTPYFYSVQASEYLMTYFAPILLIINYFTRKHKNKCDIILNIF